MIECEYCGNDHDVRELCSDRRGISRRRFFSLSARAIVGVALAPQIIDAAQALIQPSLGTIGGIDRATFTFWRNQGVNAGVLDVEAMRRIYNECSNGPGHPPNIVLGLRHLVAGDA